MIGDQGVSSGSMSQKARHCSLTQDLIKGD
jgi:hypothetical protein